MKINLKNISAISLIILIAIVAFNFNRFFILPKYRTPILDNMIDPEATNFKNEKIYGDFLCGEFNSKNSFGAYTGFNRFISNSNVALFANQRVLREPYDAKEDLEFETSIREILGDDADIKSQEDRFQILWKKACK
jgi:hypothetical protein